MKPLLSIIGDETSRPAWPQLGGDVAGTADALILIDADSGVAGGGTISKLVFRGENITNVDAPVALKVTATNGQEASVVFTDNRCERPWMNASGSAGLATIHMEAMNGAINSSTISANQIECSDRGGIELLSAAGDGEVAGYGLTISDNYITTNDDDSSFFGIRWNGVDLGAEDGVPSASVTIDGNLIRPEDGGIIDGVQIICEEHSFWGSNGFENNTIAGCSGNGLVLSSDGWESENDAEITFFSYRNEYLNNGGSGVVLIWDPTNHSSDQGYGYIHFLDESSLIAGNLGFGFELKGIGVNSSVSVYNLRNDSILDNVNGALSFSNLALGSTAPESELLEVIESFANCIVYGNGSSSSAQIAGLSAGLLDAVLGTVTYSDWKDHPLAALATDPCVPEAGSQYVIDCDPTFVSEIGVDHHLSIASPCIDVGDNNGVNGLLDIDRDDRIQDGDCDDEDVVDMGCDERPADCE